MSETNLVALRYPNRQLGARILQAWESGQAVLPLDTSLPHSQVADLLERFRPAQLHEPGATTKLGAARPVDGAVAAVIPTSGSSGPPKGVLLTHDALRWSAGASIRRLGVEPSLRWLCCLPISHVAGLAIVVRSALSGTTPAVHDRFDPEAIRRQKDADLISLVPTQLTRLLDAGVDLRRFAAVLLGGGPAGESLLERAAAAGATVVQTYGMTETCGGCVYDARPLDGVSVRVSGGIIELAGPMLMSGYRLEAELTRQVLTGGWFTTSDLGRLDNGRLTVLGRADNVIITGGEKVSARRVTQLLVEHPGIADAAVLGLPDPDWGQRVAAVVVAGEGKAVDEAQVARALRTKAAPYEVPKLIRTVELIPRTRSGKPDLPAIRELLRPES
ncbi:MAG: AMP-binding protein [Actinomycetota bacterium]